MEEKQTGGAGRSDSGRNLPIVVAVVSNRDRYAAQQRTPMDAMQCSREETHSTLRIFPVGPVALTYNTMSIILYTFFFLLITNHHSKIIIPDCQYQCQYHDDYYY